MRSPEVVGLQVWDAEKPQSCPSCVCPAEHAGVQRSLSLGEGILIKLE